MLRLLKAISVPKRQIAEKSSKIELVSKRQAESYDYVCPQSIQFSNAAIKYVRISVIVVLSSAVL